MAEPQQQNARPATPEFLLDDADQLTAEEQAGLDSEQTDEPIEQQPEGLPAKQPAQQQADATQPPPKKEPPKNIPYPRFQEVIEKANRLEAELAQERDTRARLDERVKMAREAEERAAAEARAKPAAELPTKLGTRPDPSIDPYGADLWDANRKNEILEHRVAQNEMAVGQTAEQIQANRAQQEFANWVNNDTSQFRAQHPDYEQAANHVYRWRVQHWMELGRTEQQARTIVDQEAAASAMMARETGKSVAERFYKMAQETGYQANADGSPAKPALVPEVQPSATQAARERLSQVRNGQKFQGLSRVPAERAENVDWANLGAQEIADIPEEQFAEDLNDPVKGPQLRKALSRLELGQ